MAHLLTLIVKPSRIAFATKYLIKHFSKSRDDSHNQFRNPKTRSSQKLLLQRLYLKRSRSNEEIVFCSVNIFITVTATVGYNKYPLHALPPHLRVVFSSRTVLESNRTDLHYSLIFASRKNSFSQHSGPVRG